MAIVLLGQVLGEVLDEVLDDGSAQLGTATALAAAAAHPKIRRRRANDIMLSYRMLSCRLLSCRLGAPQPSVALK
jgi:hypothetical protein